MEQTAVICSLDDWHLYGLVLTDVDFVKVFFTHVQNRMGDTVRADKLEKVTVQRTLRDYFELKGAWKFTSSEVDWGNITSLRRNIVSHVLTMKKTGIYGLLHSILFLSALHLPLTQKRRC